MFGMQGSSPSPSEDYGYSDHRHHENAAASCISGFFRRLLCKNLPTLQPPDYDYEDFSRTGSSPPPEGVEEEMKLNVGDVGTAEVVTGPSPNIVARLMGLESMPEFDWMPRTPESFGRSRSANSYLSWFDSDPIDLHKEHRRVKTSSSFREIPTFLKQENDDFLLLSFDFDHDKHSSKRANKENKKKPSDSSKSCKEKVNKGVLQIKKKKCDSEIVASSKKISESQLKDKQSRLRRPDAQLSVLRQQPCQPLPKCSKVSSRKEKIGVVVEKKAESDSSSENSSPVSVLDPPFEAESEFPTPDRVLRRKPVDSGAKKKVASELRTEQKTSEDHKVANDIRLLKTGLNLANEEILRNLNWVSRDWCDESKETCAEIELQIMDSLLCSLAYELSTAVINLYT